MATSEVISTEFQADFVITDAYERCGRMPGDLTAWSLQTAMNSLNLLFLDWQNKNVLEWNIDKQEHPLVRGAESFLTAAGTVSVLNVYLRRRGGNDTPMISVARDEYSGETNKDSEGRPQKYWQYRPAGGPPELFIWQPSDRDAGVDGDVIHYWRVKRTDDVTAPTETLDTVDRWIEATTASLAEMLFEKTPLDAIARMPPGVYAQKTADLKRKASEKLYFAQTEDRDKATLTFAPYSSVEDL